MKHACVCVCVCVCVCCVCQSGSLKLLNRTPPNFTIMFGRIRDWCTSSDFGVRSLFRKWIRLFLSDTTFCSNSHNFTAYTISYSGSTFWSKLECLKPAQWRPGDPARSGGCQSGLKIMFKVTIRWWRGRLAGHGKILFQTHCTTPDPLSSYKKKKHEKRKGSQGEEKEESRKQRLEDCKTKKEEAGRKFTRRVLSATWDYIVSICTKIASNSLSEEISSNISMILGSRNAKSARHSYKDSVTNNIKTLALLLKISRKVGMQNLSGSIFCLLTKIICSNSKTEKKSKLTWREGCEGRIFLINLRP